MQLDKQSLVSDRQDLAKAAGTYLSDYSIDLGVTGSDAYGGSLASVSDPGKSDLKFLAQVVETFLSGGAATLQVNLVSADDAALTSNVTVLESTAVLAKAVLVAGYKFLITGSLPPGISQRFVGLQFIIGTAATTAGKVTAGFVIDRQTA